MTLRVVAPVAVFCFAEKGKQDLQAVKAEACLLRYSIPPVSASFSHPRKPAQRSCHEKACHCRAGHGPKGH